MSSEQHDGVWRPERLVSGSWIAARYVDYGPEFHRRYGREEVCETRRGERFPVYDDTFEQCEQRCERLNEDPDQ